MQWIGTRRASERIIATKLEIELQRRGATDAERKAAIKVKGVKWVKSAEQNCRGLRGFFRACAESRSVWSARSLLPLSCLSGGRKRRQAGTHSKRFAPFDCGFAALRPSRLYGISDCVRPTIRKMAIL